MNRSGQSHGSGSQKRFLVFPKPAIGDVLLATPLLHAIRRAEPEARIDVMCYPGQEGILEGNPDIDAIVAIPVKPSLRELARICRALWRRYDVAITNGADDRVHLYLFCFGRTRVSVVLQSSAAWKRWVTQHNVIEGPERMHALLRNNALGEALGYPSEYDVRAPTIAANGSPGEALTGVLADGCPIAVVHVDARLPYKRWTVDGWRAVIEFLADRGFRVCATGGTRADELAYIERILKHGPPGVVDVAGQLSFAELAELLRRSRLYVGVDTVASHIAAAVGTPAVVLFGPERPSSWGPWPAGYVEPLPPWSDDGTQQRGNVLIIQGRTRCSTCGPGDCRRRRNRGTDCPLMLGIASDQVIAGLETLFEQAVNPTIDAARSRSNDTPRAVQPSDREQA